MSKEFLWASEFGLGKPETGTRTQRFLKKWDKFYIFSARGNITLNICKILDLAEKKGIDSREAELELKIEEQKLLRNINMWDSKVHRPKFYKKRLLIFSAANK
jgi:hypothetical protein